MNKNVMNIVKGAAVGMAAGMAVGYIGKKAADVRDGGGEYVAEISGEIVGEALDDLGNLILKVGNAESAANFVDKANITRGGIKERRQTIEKAD